MAQPIILLVEDDESVLNLVSLFLEGAGYSEFAAAETAQAARDLWKAHSTSIRLVLSDLTLPDGNGVALVREFLGENKGCRAILMTGFGAEYIDLGPEANGRSTLLQKPFTRDEFTKIVKACLS